MRVGIALSRLAREDRNMRDCVATFNTGSSSLKFALYEIINAQLGACLLRCNLKGLNDDVSIDLVRGGIACQDGVKAAIADIAPAPTHLLPALIDYMSKLAADLNLVAIGHRIVHGGQHHIGPCQSNKNVLTELETLSVFAPDHQPHNLAGVEALSASHAHLLQSLSFDTSFHRSIPRTAQLYAIPKTLTDKGLLRFGFHGLSYQHIAEHAPCVLEGQPQSRIIAAHLGSGASLCAIKSGKSVATTMGLTALSGIPMAKRCGDVDPGLILYLMQDNELSHDQISDMLYHRSGLLGLSGISANTDDLLRDDRPSAKQAIAHYVDRVSREIGALIVALEGLDAIVFTGGVGENAPEIRRRICQKLRYLGLKLDQKANLASADIITEKTSSITAAVIKADEEQIIARDAINVWTAA